MQQIHHAEWAMSPVQFNRDWPPSTERPAKDRNGRPCTVWHFGPAGDPIGYGTGLDRRAAEWQRDQIRQSAIKLTARMVWC